MYSETPKQVCDRDISQNVQPCQDKIAQFNLRTVTRKKDSPFGARLRGALAAKLNKKTLTNQEIVDNFGDLLGVASNSAVGNFLSGKRYPKIEMLISIARSVQCSLDWLLLGEGEQPVSGGGILDPATHASITTLAAIEAKDPDELIAELVKDALSDRAADMLRNHRTLRPTELRKLKVIIKLIGNEETGGNNKPATAARRTR